MKVKIEKLYRTPYGVPNGLQLTDDGLWVVDQVTDRCALLDVEGGANSYGVPKVQREIPSESSNTSGLSWGDGKLWLAANGSGRGMFREARPTDAEEGQILGADPRTGETLMRKDLPGGGGTHGVEYDRFEEGTLWLTTLKSQTLTQVRLSDWSSLRVLELPYKRAHGVVRVEDGVWVVHTADRVIVKLDVESGQERDRIDVPEPHPEPHGLSVWKERAFVYCDAASGWLATISW